MFFTGFFLGKGFPIPTTVIHEGIETIYLCYFKNFYGNMNALYRGHYRIDRYKKITP